LDLLRSAAFSHYRRLCHRCRQVKLAPDNHRSRPHWFPPRRETLSELFLADEPWQRACKISQADIVTRARHLSAASSTSGIIARLEQDARASRWVIAAETIIISRCTGDCIGTPGCRMMLKTPLSRAEYDILRLADQPIGYDPYEDGPWWVRLLQPFAFSVIRGLTLLWQV
jgi:hypothetical protein